MLQDLRFTFRLIAKDRWFAAAAVIALALGIGVNAVGFTLVNAAFLRGLPFDQANRLYVLTWQSGSGRQSVSHAELQDWRDGSRTFAGLAAFSNGSMNISDARALPEQARGTRITANAFGLLRQPTLLGRDFSPGDDRKGAEPVVIISYTFWKNRYGADPNVLGMAMRVNGQPATIIGVMPAGMRFPDNTEIWIPVIPTEAQERRDARFLAVFGRLADGVSRREALTEMNGIAARLAAAHPDTNKDLPGVRVETFTERFVGGAARTMFLVVMGAVGFVLLIACANVANLLLSRSANRVREVALRTALGATRWRVVRQLLVESVVLAFIGGSFGLLLAYAGVRVFDASLTDPGKPFWIDFRVDYVVFGYVAAICVLTAILFGLAPALHVSRTNTNEVLKEGGRGSSGNRRARWFSGTMIVTELALTVVLLAGASLMIRSFMNLQTLEVGFPTGQLMTMRMQLPEKKYPTPEARTAFYDRLEPALAALSGVDAVAITTTVPPFQAGERPFEIDGRPARQPDTPAPTVATVTISPRFFEVIGVGMRRGRALRDIDGAAGSETVVINERMASQFFPGEDPIGRRLRLFPRDKAPNQPTPVWRTIVGISPSIRHTETRQVELNAVVYVPHRQEPPAGASLIVRSPLPPASLVDSLRRTVQAIDADQPVFTVQTLDQMMDGDRWPFRVFGVMFGIFAVIALVLSAVGLYAVMAYSVTQRTSEIGLRMALGAQAGQVRWMILKLGLAQLVLGLTLGLAGALALSTVMERMLVGITSSDPVTFAVITIMLTIVSIAACLLPARRATLVDPLVALRAE
jgi:putative ABC transport system permease protein